ncbi:MULTISPECIES: TetR family transcriptional regulator C-terminal domain-containing protein [unclassified Leifsonia]|uniref:TetR/AcrR family transcriptional regulator n=1 Tax=unclassified Leifsonia TaxID=2663824 RepID=UPI0008A7EE8A|nr:MULTISPECIES: TetR family transcriptional regulator C-terminal domain-containing protein [unclassified Leifsonia]SEI01940.1 DNA-binding transcriptional regulator YbjK [Leifsonia sp. CL154]SFL70474.1 DNA-binding transcriptional regulator YbjK [Leifsonia sp. CL147]
MSRAARRPPAERRAELSAAARDVALADGLAAVTLRGVAARAGVAPALVAHYHPAMDELVASAFRAVVAAELDELRGLLAPFDGPTARLDALLRTLLDGTREDVTLVWVEAWALGRRNEALAAAVRGEMDAWQALILSVIEDGVAAGDFRPDDPAQAAWQLLGMIDGLNAQALVRWGAGGERGPALARAVEGMLGLERGALGDTASLS